jgi:DHA1 family inner membrane transport protein
LAANAWQLAGVRLLIGVASSIAQAMILAWLVGGAGRVARGRVMAHSEAFFSATGLVIPALGGLLGGALGWRVAFAMGAVAAVLGLAAVFAFTRATSAARSVGLGDAPSVSPAHATIASGWLELRQAGRVLLAVYLVTFVVFFCRNGLLNAVLPVLGTDQLGFQPFQIGLLFSTINAIGIGAVLFGGRLGDRLGRYRLLAPALALLFGAQALLLVVHDQVSYIVVGLLQGLAFFINPLPVGLLGDALPRRMRPRGIAIYRAVSDTALLSAPALLGVALQLGGFAAAELLSVGITLLVLVVVWAVRARRV